MRGTVVKSSGADPPSSPRGAAVVHAAGRVVSVCSHMYVQGNVRLAENKLWQNAVQEAAVELASKAVCDRVHFHGGGRLRVPHPLRVVKNVCVHRRQSERGLAARLACVRGRRRAVRETPTRCEKRTQAPDPAILIMCEVILETLYREGRFKLDKIPNTALPAFPPPQKHYHGLEAPPCCRRSHTRFAPVDVLERDSADDAREPAKPGRTPGADAVRAATSLGLLGPAEPKPLTVLLVVGCTCRSRLMGDHRLFCGSGLPSCVKSMRPEAQPLVGRCAPATRVSRDGDAASSSVTVSTGPIIASPYMGPCAAASSWRRRASYRATSSAVAPTGGRCRSLYASLASPPWPPSARRKPRGGGGSRGDGPAERARAGESDTAAAGSSPAHGSAKPPGRLKSARTALAVSGLDTSTPSEKLPPRRKRRASACAAAGSVTSTPLNASAAACSSDRSPKPPGRRNARASAATCSALPMSTPASFSAARSSPPRSEYPPGRWNARASAPGAAGCTETLTPARAAAAASSAESSPPAPRRKKRAVAATAAGLPTSKPTFASLRRSSSDSSP
eukprot:247251-Chlamydomonas_euryale.AAC.4